MATIQEWSDDLESMKTEKIVRMMRSLDVLATWSLFSEQYKEMPLLKTILYHELDKR